MHTTAVGHLAIYACAQLHVLSGVIMSAKIVKSTMRKVSVVCFLMLKTLENAWQTFLPFLTRSLQLKS